mgnify:CR=1 FL=1
MRGEPFFVSQRTVLPTRKLYGLDKSRRSTCLFASKEKHTSRRASLLLVMYFFTASTSRKFVCGFFDILKGRSLGALSLVY